MNDREGWSSIGNFVVVIVCVHISQSLLCMTQQLYNGRNILSAEELNMRMKRVVDMEEKKFEELRKEQNKTARVERPPKEYPKRKRKLLS